MDYRLETKQWFSDFEGYYCYSNVLYLGKKAVWILPNSRKPLTLKNAIYCYQNGTGGRRL